MGDFVVSRDAVAITSVPGDLDRVSVPDKAIPGGTPTG